MEMFVILGLIFFLLLLWDFSVSRLKFCYALWQDFSQIFVYGWCKRDGIWSSLVPRFFVLEDGFIVAFIGFWFFVRLSGESLCNESSSSCMPISDCHWLRNIHAQRNGTEDYDFDGDGEIWCMICLDTACC